MSISISALQKTIIQQKYSLPSVLQKEIFNCSLLPGKNLTSLLDFEKIKELFPHTNTQPLLTFSSSNKKEIQSRPLNVGVILSGGQASGGHNVIAGIFDALQNIHAESILYGFLKGPAGLENNQYEILNQQKIDSHRNTGGFSIIGSGRTKLDTTQQFDKCIKVSKNLNLDAIVIIGGDDSNTNAAILAEYYQNKKQKTIIIGVPKTIDGDLKNNHIPISFGFDTACKTYAELVGNLARDTCSAQKYWHFIKLMGRSASHIALEVGLQTQSNITIISEEIKEKKISLEAIVDSLCEIIIDRSNKGKDYGIILIPEGLIEFIETMNNLISDLNHQLFKYKDKFPQFKTITEKIQFTHQVLSSKNAIIFENLPHNIQSQLLLDRDPHGNVQVSRIETESLLIQLVKENLQKNTTYKGSFSALSHFFGYEGRSAFPSIFDASYTYTLGYSSMQLALHKKNGYMISIKNILDNIENWNIHAVPITSMLNIELRHGEKKPVIKKALVDLNGPVFKHFSKYRKQWEKEDLYLFPGPIQYFGPVANTITTTLKLEQQN